MTEPTLEDFIMMLRTSDDPDVRRNAAWTMGRQRDIRIIEPLIEALSDTNADVRLRVAEALGNMRDERTVAPLIAALDDDDSRVRAALVASLGRQGDSSALVPVIERLQDSDAIVRTAAAETLHLLPDTSAVPPLVQTLLHDENDDVRYYAAKSLSFIGGTATVDALLAALNDALQPHLQIYVIEILAGLYDKRAVEPLRSLTNSPDEGVRAAAQWALHQLGDKA